MVRQPTDGIRMRISVISNWRDIQLMLISYFKSLSAITNIRLLLRWPKRSDGVTADPQPPEGDTCSPAGDRIYAAIRQPGSFVSQLIQSPALKPDVVRSCAC